MYDPDCNILLSPTLLTANWSVKEWEMKPKNIFIDSGAYSNVKYPSIENVLKDQIRIADGANQSGNIYYSHADVILPGNLKYIDEIGIIKKNLNRALEYIELFNKLKVKGTPVGIIQASCEEDLLCSYFQLKEFGYEYFAIGSISKRMKAEKDILKNTLHVINAHKLKPIHIFGITLPLFAGSSIFENITSFDTSTPIKLGYYGTVLYSNPLRRYVIKPTSYQKHRDKNFAFRIHLDEPIACSCPICLNDPLALTHKDMKTAKINRIIHNYFQIKFAVENL
jgi:tRNA-guanine family transglycosylase